MEGKRRLPLWMVGVSTADKRSKSLDADTNNVITNDEVSVVPECTKPKPEGRARKHKREVCLPGNETRFLVKCETKRKKRAYVEKDVMECDDVQEVVKKRKRGSVRRSVEELDPSRKKNEKNYQFESTYENQSPSPDEDDEDLTMDDMLSIAKEFVENDKTDMGQHKPSEGHCQLKSTSSCTSSSMTGTSIVPQDARLSMHEETASHHSSNETTSEVTLADSRMTGDPAQDMLDLFLGPLLKKPIGKEMDRPIAKDIIPPHEAKNQQPGVISNKPITLTKKKSSLRDAVAMLLD